MKFTEEENVSCTPHLLMSNGMPVQPRAIGRQFVSCYYNIMNKSPDNLHCLYTESANFCHDNVDPADRETITVTGKSNIRDVMIKRMEQFRHTCTRVNTVDTYKTLEDGLIVQLLGEVSFNDDDFRSFSQTFLLVPKNPFKYFVQNDIFRFNELPQSTASQCSDAAQCQSIHLDEECYDRDVENTSFDAVEQIDDIESDTAEAVMNGDYDYPTEQNDMEKSIMDMQSMNLKNVLLETRAITKEIIMKRVPTPPTVEHVANESEEKPDNEMISEQQNQLFRDKCILTIGNVINPNIEFDDVNPGETATEETIDASEIEGKLDETVLRDKKKGNFRKRKEKKRLSRIQRSEKAMESPNDSPTETSTVIDVKISWASEVGDSSDENRAECEKVPTKSNEQRTFTPPLVPPKPKTFADLVKKESQSEEWQDDWKNEATDRRSSDAFTRSSKLRSSVPQRRGRQENRVSPNESTHVKRSSSNGDLLQIFIGNIPHEADDDAIRAIFGQFGKMRRFRMHSNPRTSRVPHYAFINYENIQSVRKVLARRNSFYWPDKNGQKLNVNGDVTLMAEFEGSSPTTNETVTTKKSMKSIGTDTADLELQSTRDLKQFHKNFHLAESKESGNRRSSKPNVTDVVSTVKNERSATRNGSTRA